MPRHRTAQRFPKFAALALSLPTALATGGCASIELSRDTQTSGAFVSKGFAFTIASIDIPRPAILIARDNAVDARLTNMQVTSSSVTPDLGWWDWLLDIIGVRWATIRGTWGFSGATPQASGAPAD
jgi:hypothetical protein